MSFRRPLPMSDPQTGEAQSPSPSCSSLDNRNGKRAEKTDLSDREKRIARRRKNAQNRKEQRGTPSGFGRKSEIRRNSDGRAVVVPRRHNTGERGQTTNGQPSPEDIERRIQQEVAARVKAEEARIRMELERQMREREEVRLHAEKERVRRETEIRMREQMEWDRKETEKRVEKKLRHELGGSGGNVHAWDIDPKQLIIGDELGSGAFGVVYSGQLHGKPVAIKTLHMGDAEEDILESFRNEVQIMVRLRHPNILLFMGASFNKDNLLLVTELMPKGSVDDIIHTQGIKLPFKVRMKIARHCALGMNWLHNLSPPFLHLDLKSGNLLVDDSWNVKVADFGLSQIKGSQEGPVGSPFYMAPEMLMNKPYNERADVYSFGIVLWELLTQEEPYKDEFEDLEEFIEAIIVDGERPPIPEKCEPTLRSLLSTCYDINPAKRLSFADMLNQKLFEKILIEHVVHSRSAQKFWKSQLLEDDAVDFSVFLKAIASYFQLNMGQLDEDDMAVRCIKAVMADKKGKVTLEKFGAVTDWFGPFDNWAKFADTLRNVVMSPWFHGNIKRKDAEMTLNKQKKGTFLVRFSETSPGCFSIDLMGNKNRISHHRVVRDRKRMYVYDGRAFPTLIDLVMGNKKKPLCLKSPCPGSPYTYLYSGGSDYDSADAYGASIYGDI